MRPIERRAMVWAVAVLAVAAAVGGLVASRLWSFDVEARRRTATELARASARAIEQRLSTALQAASALAAMVEGGARDPQLERVASRLLALDGGTMSLQLAKDGVISHIWPMAGNEAAYGLDLLRHPVHGPFVLRAKTSRAALLYGPFELVQGGRGLTVRVPIWVREGGGERFWGLSSAILRMQDLLDRSRVPNLAEAGLDYAILRAPEAAEAPLLLASSRESRWSGAEAVRVPVNVPGQRWWLEVSPRRGGFRAFVAWVPAFGVITIALLMAVVAYRAAALPAVLRREVAARTQELERAHAEQRRAEEAQRQSQKLESIGLLAGGVAHDFNNLLAGILGYADLVAADAPPGSIAAEAARTIVQATRRAAELTRQLLAIARLGQHRIERVDLHDVVREVAGLLARTLEKSIRLDVRLAARRHTVDGDPSQLQQVVLNLAVNARDAMPDGGTLTIETADASVDAAGGEQGLAPGAYVALAVEDTGVGIPEPLRDRIFEPFFTTKPEGKGTGLGLATAFGIAKGHGGTVRIRSEEGVGSRFVVYLPATSGEAAAPPAPPEPMPRGTGTVLVVDDEPLVRATFARVLASLGYVPAAVEGGEEAIAWLAAQPSPPAAVLLDLSMPGMDGRQCFRRMRERFPSLRVVVTSGFSKEGRGDELLAEGAVAFIEKPFVAADLAMAMHAATAGDG